MWPFLMACSAVDRAPPELAVEGPAAPVRTAATFHLEAGDAGGLGKVILGLPDGRAELLPLGAERVERATLEWTLGLESLPHGAHDITFTAVDASWMANRAEHVVRLSVDREPPTLQVARQSRLIAQGRTLPIWVDADEPLARAEVAIFGKTVPMYPVDGAWRALVGVAIRQPPGEAPLRVVAHDEAGNRAVVETEVAVEATEFETTGQIALTRADIEQDRDPEDARLARRARDEAYARRSPTPRWEGPMGLPVAYGKAAAPFGRYFTYRDGERSYHTGLDLEKRLGARISAPAAGTVSLVTTQPVFGRVVIVDHGHGVSTAYNHLDTVEVKRGDEVYRGQSLGTMGASGQAYGPHLHWVVVVAGTAVDPADWLDDDFATSPFR